MSNSISAIPLLQSMQPTRMKTVSTTQNAVNTSTIKPKAGLFDQFLSQAEKDFLAVQLQQIQRTR